MIRGLNLALAALVVVSLGVGSVFAFTPSVSGVPDVIIGDRTPGNTSASNDLPSDPFTHADSLEGLASQAPNVYDFPDAFNIFGYVSDEPNGVAGFTSDDQLIYQFIAGNVFPSAAPSNTPGNDRISVNGTRISPTAFTTVTVSSTGLLSFKDMAFSADADNSTFPVSNPPFSYLFTNTAGSETVTNGDTTLAPSGPVTVLDQVILELRVTNQVAAFASDSIFVTTVDDGPDALSGTPVALPQPLDGWGYNGSANTAGILGPTYPGDAQATGVEVADGEADGSVSDLRLTTGDTSGDFFHAWTSPAAIIPFTQDGTYHLRWNVSSTIATAAASPTVRFRWAYTNLATLGGGNVVVAPSVSLPPASGQDYNMMFDQLDVASLTGTVPGGDVENTIRLTFENYDFDSPIANVIGGGQTELNSLEIATLDSSFIVANSQIERQATDYTTSIVAETGVQFSNASTPITVTETATNFTITAAVTNVAGSISVYGGSPIALNDYGLGFQPFVPANTSGRVYRVSADVDTTANSVAAPLPRVTLTAASFAPGNAQRFTTTIDVEATALSTGLENPGANGVNNYAAYLALPAGGDLNGGAYGNAVNGTVRLTDFGNAGGSVIGDNFEVRSIPESLLP